jgi:uncharacterized protein with HEPN domain
MSEAGRDILDYIQDILTSILEVEEFTEGMTFEDFSKDKKTVNAVIRSLEVLGEATRHIPINIRAKNKEVPWAKMSGLRNILIHEYMGVDLKTVWNIVTKRIQELKLPIVHIKANLNKAKRRSNK